MSERLAPLDDQIELRGLLGEGGMGEVHRGWDRRLAEWTHQIDVLNIEIQQIERQILAAQRRRGNALKVLDTHRRQIENAADLPYSKYLSWRGAVTVEPPRRPEPDRISASVSGRTPL